MTWVEFLVYFKRKYCLDQNILKLENQFLNLKKGSLTMEEYTNAFTDKMEFALHIVLDKLAKIDRYVKGLPWKYIVQIKQTPTFEATIWSVKYVEDKIKQRTVDKNKVGKKRNSEGLSKSNKKGKISRSKPIEKRYGGNNEA